jgi:hypothetical protein
MTRKLFRTFRFGLAAAVVGCFGGPTMAAPIPLTANWQANAYNQPMPNGVHATLSSESATGYTYTGSGTGGLPGTTTPDSRRRPRVYQDFAPFDASAVGSTLSMTYDIKLGGSVTPTTSIDTAWRFGFISTTANGGKEVSLGANADLGPLNGTNFYEFMVDTQQTSGQGTPASGEMDSGFSATLNDSSDSAIHRTGQSIVVPAGNNVAFNDTVKTQRITLTLTRITDGYNLGFSWQNLAAGGTTITNSATITTADFDTGTALAAGITTWDRLGFFVNADTVNNNGTAPWIYTLSNVSVDGVSVPEPASLTLGALVLATAAGIGGLRQRRRSRGL